MTHLSLFSGIGGLDIAAEWASFQTVGQCEWADYPTQVLEKHWPDVPRWRDIRTLTGKDFYARTGLRTVDVISGGFPCQPFSVAGKQRGHDDERYLWPEMLRVIRELEPRWVIGENVPGILNIAADNVCSDLDAQGYEVRIFDFEAAAVGAPHRRERCFFVGHSKRGGFGRVSWRRTGEKFANGHSKLEENALENSSGCRCEQSTILPQQPRRTKFISTGEGCADRGPAALHADVADTDNKRLQGSGHESCINAISKENRVEHFCETVSYAVHDRSQEQRKKSSEPWTIATGDWWAVEPDVGRVAHGVPARVERLKCLGNAVVPQQAYPIFKAIADYERG